MEIFRAFSLLAVFALPRGFVEGQNFDGFDFRPQTWCRGGNAAMLSAIELDVNKCLQRCLTDDQCYGFNYRPVDKICGVFANGCVESSNPSWNFYKKQQSSKTGVPIPATRTRATTVFTIPAFQPTATKPTTTTARPTTSTTVSTITTTIRQRVTTTPDASATPDVSNALAYFDKASDSYCVSVPTDFMSFNQYGIQNCSAVCLQKLDCFGFIFVRDTQECTMFNVRGDKSSIICTSDYMMPQAGYDWYQRRAGAAPIPNPFPSSTTLADTTTTTSWSWVDGSTTTDVFSAGIISAQFPNYYIDIGTRCFGDASTVLGQENDIVQCVAICDASSTCIGFNWRETDTQSCVIRAFGCTMDSNDAATMFYRKKQGPGANVGTTPTTPQPRFRPTTTSPTPAWEFTTQPQPLVDSSSYTTEQKRSCFGILPTKIGPTLVGDVNQCFLACNANDTCIGFNWREGDQSCVVRAVGCNMIDDQTATFYRKPQPGRATVRTSTNEQTTITTSSPGDALSYTVVSNTRCTGGQRVGEIGQALGDCQQRCNARIDCSGVNLLQDGSCVARSSCTETISEDGSVFYRKTVSSSVTSQNALPTAAVPVTRPIPNDQSPTTTSSSGSVISYAVVSGTRCTGGQRIGEIGQALGECQQTCTARSDCIGINFQQDGTCVARSGCAESSDEGSVFYRKTLSSRPQSPVTIQTAAPTSAPTTARPGNNYVAIDQVQCYGDAQTQIGGDMTDFSGCISVCDRRSECYGFNWFVDPPGTSTGSCTIRTNKCMLISAADGVTFYRKPSKAAATTTTTATQPPEMLLAGGSDYNDVNTTPSPSSSTSSPRPVVNVGAAVPTIANYESTLYIRCANDDTSTLQIGAMDCALACDQRNGCLGFNWQYSNTACTLQLATCIQTRQMGSVYYKRKLTQPSDSQSAAVSFAITSGTRCSGDGSVIKQLSGLDPCAAACLADDACYGFNFIADSGQCALRTTGCTLIRVAGTSFYRKSRS